MFVICCNFQSLSYSVIIYSFIILVVSPIWYYLFNMGTWKLIHLICLIASFSSMSRFFSWSCLFLEMFFFLCFKMFSIANLTCQIFFPSSSLIAAFSLTSYLMWGCPSVHCYLQSISTVTSFWQGKVKPFQKAKQKSLRGQWVLFRVHSLWRFLLKLCKARSPGTKLS